jgi:O-antigen ligase
VTVNAKAPERGPGCPTLAGLACVCAATVYLPIGLSGLLALAWMVGAALWLVLSRRRLARPDVLPTLCFLAWMAASSLWSPAVPAAQVDQLAHLMVLLAVPLMAATLAPAQAQRVLACFVAASVLMAVLWLAQALAPFAPPRSLAGLLGYIGNKSIANGALMALAAALLVHRAFTPEQALPWRVLWAGLGLALAAMVWWRTQTRTAHLLLLVLAATLLALHLRQRWLRLAGAAALAGLATAWMFGALPALDRVGGLAARAEAGQLADSSGYRLALYGQTWALIREAPLAGHGLAAWAELWPGRPCLSCAASTPRTTCL